MGDSVLRSRWDICADLSTTEAQGTLKKRRRKRRRRKRKKRSKNKQTNQNKTNKQTKPRNIKINLNKSLENYAELKKILTTTQFIEFNLCNFLKQQNYNNGELCGCQGLKINWGGRKASMALLRGILAAVEIPSNWRSEPWVLHCTIVSQDISSWVSRGTELLSVLLGTSILTPK